MPTNEPDANREVIVTREIAAPASVLFEAYRDPEKLKRWFGPRGWPLTRAEMDFRVGGKFQFQMTGPDGEAGPPFGGEYLEIVPNEKIVYDNGFNEPGTGRMTVTITYDEKTSGKTTLTIHTLFESVAMFEEHTSGGIVEGLNSGLDQLEEVAAEMTTAARK